MLALSPGMGLGEISAIVSRLIHKVKDSVIYMCITIFWLQVECLFIVSLEAERTLMTLHPSARGGEEESLTTGLQ